MKPSTPKPPSPEDRAATLLRVWFRKWKPKDLMADSFDDLHRMMSREICSAVSADRRGRKGEKKHGQS